MTAHSFLIVDDELDFAEMIAQYLELLNPEFCYQIAGDGIEALELLNANEFHCIITDVKMPKMDGVSFAKQIKAKGVKIPIIFISGEGSAELESKIKAVGGHDFLVKPIDLQSFNYVIEDALEEAA